MTLITLKDGSTTTDPRLSRIEQFDERSRDYPIRSTVGTKERRSYTWRCEEWFDQGREGACVGFAMGHEASARPAEFRGLDYNYLVEDVYHEAQRIDPWDGGSYPGASPQYAGTSVLAGVKVMQRKGFFDSYRWAFSTDDLCLGLGYNGPAVLGMNWYNDMYYPDENGFVRPTGDLVGGHAILARAINVRTGAITLRNSWGKDWGRNGDCYITIDDLGSILADRGEAVFMLKRTAKVIL
jgi:hypothetical protein